MTEPFSEEALLSLLSDLPALFPYAKNFWGEWGLGWPAIQHPEELVTLARYAADPDLPAGNILEIGCALGGNLLAMSVAATHWRKRGERVIGIDNLVGFGDPPDPIALSLLLRHVSSQWRTDLIIGTSHHLAYAGWTRTVRLALIDGDHSY
jgi:hypothetical protein